MTSFPGTVGNAIAILLDTSVQSFHLRCENPRQSSREGEVVSGHHCLQGVALLPA